MHSIVAAASSPQSASVFVSVLSPAAATAATATAAAGTATTPAAVPDANAPAINHSPNRFAFARRGSPLNSIPADLISDSSALRASNAALLGRFKSFDEKPSPNTRTQFAPASRAAPRAADISDVYIDSDSDSGAERDESSTDEIGSGNDEVGAQLQSVCG